MKFGRRPIRICRPLEHRAVDDSSTSTVAAGGDGYSVSTLETIEMTHAWDVTGGHPERQGEDVRRGPVELIIHGYSDYKPPASSQAFNASSSANLVLPSRSIASCSRVWIPSK